MPAAIKAVTGNAGKRAIDLQAGVQPLVVIPDRPLHLNADGKKEWDRLAPQLYPLGLISELDRANLALYCQAWGRWVHAEKQIAKLEKATPDAGLVQSSPNGYLQMSQWLIIANKSMEQVNKYAAEFGLSPSARSSVSPSANQGGDAAQPEQGQLTGVPAAPTKPTLAFFNTNPPAQPKV